MIDPFYEGPKEPRVERRLTEVPLPERPQDDTPSTTVTETDLLEIFDGLGYQINRATALIQVVEPRAKLLFVPVDPDAVEVRAAIRRQIGTDGGQIPFDLYKDMLDRRVKTARKMNLEIVGELTGDVLTDAKKIKKYLKTGGRGLSAWEEWLLSMEQFALWMVLNQLLGQFSSVEHQEVCVAKEPPGTEIGPTQLRHAVAIAAMMFILGMKEDHVMLAVRAPADALKVPPIDIINRARRLTETDLHRELSQILGASDPQLVIDYADNYIARNPMGFEDWLAYRDLRNLREHAVITYVHGHQYSKEYSTLLDFTSEFKHTTPLPSGGGVLGLFGIPGRGATVQAADVVGVTPDFYGAMANQLVGIDRGISSIAGVLTNGFTLDVLCCIGRFLGREDVERLRRMRAVLRIAMNIHSTGISLTLAEPVNVMDFAVAALQQSLLAFVQRYFDKFARDILDWVADNDDQTWNDLFACPLIEDLVVQILAAVAQLRDQIFALVRQFAGRSFQVSDGVYRRWGAMFDARRLQAILSILDRIIAAVEVCADVPADGDGQDNAPNPGEDPRIYEGVPQPIRLPPEVVAKFFQNPNPVLREQGQRPIPPVGTITVPGDPANTRTFREICRGVLPDSLLEAVFSSRDQT